MKDPIIVQVVVHSPIEKVWHHWTEPSHIERWNNASPDWHTPHAENDLREGGRFLSRMAAKDGSMSFDFSGTYTQVEINKKIAYALDDDRKVSIDFSEEENGTKIIEAFEAENQNSRELQQLGWQAILDNFKRHVEKFGKLETLTFEIFINAPVEKVFRNMLEGESYKQWTSIFSPGSHYLGNWEKGSKMLFLGPNEEGKMGGMVSTIRENIPGKYISIEHLGMIKDGVEITTGPEVDEWIGCLENYSFSDYERGTKLKVELDSNATFKEYFQNTYPKALEILKEICEK